MRLLLLNYEFPPVGGGASAASYYLASEYSRRGHRVDVLTCRAAGHAPIERLNGVTVHRVMSIRRSAHDTGVFGALTYLCAAHWKLRTLLKAENYDFAQFFFSVPTGLLSFQWRRATGKPYIVSLRGSDVPGYDPSFKLVDYLHRALRPITRRILAHSRHVVANSESLRELALKSYPENPISVVTNGVSPTIFRPASAPHKPGATIRALCVARLVKRKGIHYLLEAIEQSNASNLRVTIVGTGPEEASLRQLAKSLSIEGRVEFMGQQSPQSMANCYRSADFLVHPALAESFSMTLLEAMASGLPIVATDVGGIPELVEPDENGFLVPPGDVPALADAITRMAVPTVRARFAEANRAKILAGFTWERIGEQYLQQCFSASAIDPGSPLYPEPGE